MQGRDNPDFQRAELSLALKPRIAEKAKQNQRIAGKNYGENHPKQEVLQNSVKPLGTQKELAKTAGVSHDTIYKVGKIKENAIPEVIEAARSGEVSVSVAATKNGLFKPKVLNFCYTFLTFISNSYRKWLTLYAFCSNMEL